VSRAGLLPFPKNNKTFFKVKNFIYGKLLSNMSSINFISPDFVKGLKKLQRKQKFVLKLSKIFTLLGGLFLVLSFAPSIWYSLGAKVDDFSAAILKTVIRANKEVSKPSNNVPDWQPAFDARLTRDTTLKIPSIKVDTKINEATYDSFEDALKLSVWRVPDFGTPIDRSRPVILAAHRFGYLAWSNTYRRKNSFYNLPKLKVGDLIEITYKQRKYTYEVYGESRGEEIIDYTANLILYTCETLNSKLRIFKYARLLKI
jgi:sortase (surface protein transpeptidase)